MLSWVAPSPALEEQPLTDQCRGVEQQHDLWGQSGQPACLGWAYQHDPKLWKKKDIKIMYCGSLIKKGSYQSDFTTTSW